MLYALDSHHPHRAPSAWVAPGAYVIGQVCMAEDSSVWFGAVLRGDNAPIVLGAGSQIQDGAVLHTDHGNPLHIGLGVSVGHQAMLHGCTIDNHSLIGIQAIILNGAHIGAECLIGAGTLVPEGRIIPPRSLVLGTPARVVRSLTEAEVLRIHSIAQGYVQRAAHYRHSLTPLPS